MKTTRRLSMLWHPFAFAIGCLVTFLATIAIAAEEDAEGTLKAGAFTFTYDKSVWKSKEPLRAMTVGGLSTGAEGHAVDADFYHFGEGQGGSVDDNIKRWKVQFAGKPEIKQEVKLADGKVQFLHMEGTYLSGPPFGAKTPKENQAMLGAILPSPNGAVFIKMVGEKADVDAAVKAFKALVSSPFKAEGDAA